MTAVASDATTDRPASFDPGPELRAAAADLNRRSGATGPVTDPQVLAKVASIVRSHRSAP